jgi:TPR repeat protein
VKLARASRLANRGDVEASYGLGRAYYYGDQGAPRDYNKAARWFRVAAEGGLAEAQAMLGNCYLLGHGVAKDHKQAKLLIYAAAKSGENPRFSLEAARYSTSRRGRMAHLHACVDHRLFTTLLSPEEQAEALSSLAAGLAKCDNQGCGKVETRGCEFRSCGSCRNLVHYCSAECQLEAWEAHSLVCQRVSEWESGVGVAAGEEKEGKDEEEEDDGEDDEEADEDADEDEDGDEDVDEDESEAGDEDEDGDADEDGDGGGFE